METITPPAMKYNTISVREYLRIHRDTVENLEDFWASQASQLEWVKKWDSIIDGWGFKSRWFNGGLLSAYANIVGRHARGQISGKPALIEEDEDGTSTIIRYNDLDRLSGILAESLRQLGVKRGDWILLYAPQSIESAIVVSAAMRLATPFETVFTGFGWWELKKRIKSRKPRVVFGFDTLTRRGRKIDLLGNLEKALENLDYEPIVVVAERAESRKRREWWSLRDLVKGSSIDRDEVVESNHPLMGLHVGYVSDFKPITHSTGGYLVQTISVTRWLGLRSRDTLYCTVSLGWITGVTHCLLGALALGSTVLVYTGAPDYPDWSRWLELIDYYSVTVFLTTSSALRMIVRRAGDKIRDYELDSLKAIITTGEPMEESLWRSIYVNLGSGSSPLIDSIPRSTGRIPVFNTYIQSELGTVAIGNLPNSAFAPILPGSAGLPVLGLDLDVVRDDCTPLRGSIGRLAVRKPWPAMPVEYPREFEENWINGCYDTGDYALMTSDGYIRVLGRRDYVMKVSGYRISPGAIESALEETGVARRAVAFSIPDEERFETVILAVEGAEQDAARRAVRELVGPIAEPSRVYTMKLEGDKASLRAKLKLEVATGSS